jgi:hypothetical protein
VLPATGEVPFEVVLDASASSVASGAIVKYTWELSDGRILNGAILTLGVSAPGQLNVILTVTSDTGRSSTTAHVITARGPASVVNYEKPFDTSQGTEYRMPNGLAVSVRAVSSGGPATLIVVETPSPMPSSCPELAIQAAYDITIARESDSGSSKGEEAVDVALSFDIPSTLDPSMAVVLEWTDEGWVLASSPADQDGNRVLGGEIDGSGEHIVARLEHLSLYALAFVKFTTGTHY